MNTMSVVPESDPLRKDWEKFKQTAQYASLKTWAASPEHLQDSLWGVYCRAYEDATTRAANLHEQVDSASDAERLDGIPGAGAMGAVVEYRDKIRDIRVN